MIKFALMFCLVTFPAYAQKTPVTKYMTLESAKIASDEEHQKEVLKARESGYEIRQKDGRDCIVGKNAATGLSDPTATMTCFWDEPQVDENGEFKVQPAKDSRSGFLTE